MNILPLTQGYRILAYFLAFFGCLLLVDGVMVTLAIRTQTGMVTEHPYEKGLAYNKVVQAAATQEALGWKGDIVFTQTGKDKGTLALKVKDVSGNILVFENIKADIYRPTQAGMDFTVPFHDDVAKIAFPRKGLWEIRIYATKGHQAYQQSTRIIVE